jgi:hypothetical protein
MRALSLLVTLLPSIVVLTLPCAAAEPPPAHERTLREVYVELDRLFHRYYPRVTSELSNDAVHFEYGTRDFLIHEPRKTGEWQDARPERGPNRGGILCAIEVRKGRYPGAAVVPQTFDKRYFRLWVAAPYSARRDEHLYVHLSYPPDADVAFLERFVDIVASFAPAAVKDSPPARSVTAEEFFEYSCVHHYMKANSVPMFDGSLGYAVEYLDAGPELLDALSDAAKIAAAKLPPPNYADPEHGSPAVIASCRRDSRSEQVRKIIESDRHRARGSNPGEPRNSSGARFGDPGSSRYGERRE